MPIGPPARRHRPTRPRRRPRWHQAMRHAAEGPPPPPRPTSATRLATPLPARPQIADRRIAHDRVRASRQPDPGRARPPSQEHPHLWPLRRRASPLRAASQTPLAGEVPTRSGRRSRRPMLPEPMRRPDRHGPPQAGRGIPVTPRGRWRTGVRHVRSVGPSHPANQFPFDPAAKGSPRPPARRRSR